VTLVADSHVPDAAYQAARTALSEQEMVDRTMAVVAINGWNRLMVAFRDRLPSHTTTDGAAAGSVPRL
jgi:alkylhydroperoxidase family enzyme